MLCVVLYLEWGPLRLGHPRVIELHSQFTYIKATKIEAFNSFMWVELAK